jgi:hypothetical protein
MQQFTIPKLCFQSHVHVFPSGFKILVFIHIALTFTTTDSLTILCNVPRDLRFCRPKFHHTDWLI